MKKMTQLINESKMNFDSVEDYFLPFEDKGFQLETFNDIGGIKGDKRVFFGNELSGEINHIYQWEPSSFGNHTIYILTYSKSFLPFTESDLYFMGNH
jgi:hypothetical protein